MEREDHLRRENYDSVANTWSRGDGFVWHALVVAFGNNEDAIEALEALKHWWSDAPVKELSAKERNP